MEISLRVTKDFERCLDDLKKKYGEDFEYINGLHPSQLDFSDFLDNFVSQDTMADATIDPNANAKHKDIRSFMTEKGKSEDKLFGLNKIFLEIKKKWGLRTARQWLEQEFSKGFYLNDSASASYFPYCWANDFTRLAKEGLFFLKDYNNQAPKHLTTYFDDVIEFVSYLSNRQSGAVGMPNVLIWAYYFWKNDVNNNYYLKDPETYLKQNFQKFIFRLNQPFLRIDQCAFTNVSIFDRPYLEALFGGMEFPDGTFAIDEIEEIIKCQKVFMETVSEIREENMFTFPVLTFSLLYTDGHFVDEEFARWASNHNIKWSDSNFFVSDNVGVLSNCPLNGKTPILYWCERHQEFKVSPIKDLYFRLQRNKQKTIKVISNGKLIECKINQFNEPAVFNIELVNGTKIKTTANHLNKVYGNSNYVPTSQLTTDDYLPISLIPYEQTNNLSYEDGKLVGMFLGDGSYKNKTEIIFSLNIDTDQDDIKFIHQYCTTRFGAKITETMSTNGIGTNNKCVNISVNSAYCRGLIEQFVLGDCALNKQINYKALSCSLKFRQGILDGLYTTDGGNSNRIYTSSEKLKDSLITMLATMGIPSNFITDTREGRLGTNTCYTIRWYTPKGRTQTKNVYIIEDNYFWFKIKSITNEKNNSDRTSYCLEIINDSQEPVFMLANGIVTHNCRLLSDTKKLDAFINSIGGTALSVGSCRVSTINLVRIAYESKLNKKKYIEILKDRVLLDCKALYSMRHILKRNIDKGLLPNYQDGAIELDKQFCTIGGIGLYEVMDMFGLIDTDEFGYKSYSDEAVKFATQILNTINEVKDNFDCDFSFNVEMIPAENCAGVICQADNLIYEQDKYFIYSNQWIPLTEKCTIKEKCRLGSLFDKLCGGGCIAHINIENRFSTEEEAWDMLNYVASNGVIYFAFTTKISVCKNKHAFIGRNTCPRCGEPIYDTYSRVVGFYTPVSSYQKIRKQEFNRRKWYDVLNKNEIS